MFLTEQGDDIYRKTTTIIEVLSQVGGFIRVVAPTIAFISIMLSKFIHKADKLQHLSFKISDSLKV